MSAKEDTGVDSDITSLKVHKYYTYLQTWFEAHIVHQETGFYLWFHAGREIKASYQNISVNFADVVPPVNSLVPEDKTRKGTTCMWIHMHMPVLTCNSNARDI